MMHDFDMGSCRRCGVTADRGYMTDCPPETTVNMGPASVPELEKVVMSVVNDPVKYEQLPIPPHHSVYKPVVIPDGPPGFPSWEASWGNYTATAPTKVEVSVAMLDAMADDLVAEADRLLKMASMLREMTVRRPADPKQIVRLVAERQKELLRKLTGAGDDPPPQP